MSGSFTQIELQNGTYMYVDAAPCMVRRRLGEQRVATFPSGRGEVVVNADHVRALRGYEMQDDDQARRGRD